MWNTAILQLYTVAVRRAARGQSLDDFIDDAGISATVAEVQLWPVRRA